MNNPYRDPYEDITDLESYQIDLNKYANFEVGMGDFYARVFYKMLRFSLKERIPASVFRQRIFEGGPNLQRTFHMILPFTNWDNEM